ncbi:hypothetical protein D8B26_004688 [Coccidioides posadasii str. Silveira]|uniref:Uncharacterized protein n=1 Tax=Coccidioides posadasii (strain RMSCC 757 / Silveira) TaxID=443226 RepID=E9D6Y4_COCPS|nr:conserved hypothetical protein [Coccidioides posadasii str. Silveira]QVM10025.1 hypothetical protein D8B26_004688 [Coccidioides posadasii str. Silveira]
MESSSHSSQVAAQGQETSKSPADVKYPEMPLPQVTAGNSDRDLPANIPAHSKEETLNPLMAPKRDKPSLPAKEEERMFQALKAVFEDAGEDTASFDLRNLMASLELVDKESAYGPPNARILEAVKSKLYQLWETNSGYMARVTEVLANGSRDPKWRLPYGTSGILDFYLRVISTQGVDDDILLHALRLIGNSCADTDENRQQVVDRNYTRSIMMLFDNPALVHVAIPVIYNICVDFEPAQAQIAMDGICNPLLKLLASGSIQGNALLSYTYELVEIASGQGQFLDSVPDDSLLLIITLATASDISLPHFTSITNSLAAYLQTDRFQRVCILQGQVENVLSILSQSYEMEDEEMSSDDEQALSSSRLKLNHALSDLSGLEIYPTAYPLGSALTGTLISWLKTSNDHLQICACVMLGNLAREDAICESMVQKLQVHLPLIAILESDARSPVLHSVLGFLKNLTIAGNNREYLGEAGIIERLSRLWAVETAPQIQFMAASLTRQVILSSVSNISRLLDPLSSDPNSPANVRTYLSLMLSLFSKTDSSPTRTEIGRTVASICRVLLRFNPEPERINTTEALVKRLFGLHKDVARPIGAMITQTDWPVVRSEGWFALALMASNKEGSEAVGDCLQSMSVTDILCDMVRKRIPEPSESESTQEKTDRARLAKDRDNALILLHGLLQHRPPTLTSARREIFEQLMAEIGQPKA